MPPNRKNSPDGVQVVVKAWPYRGKGEGECSSGSGMPVSSTGCSRARYSVDH